jgi:hypothetical protein
MKAAIEIDPGVAVGLALGKSPANLPTAWGEELVVRRMEVREWEMYHRQASWKDRWEPVSVSTVTKYTGCSRIELDLCEAI